MEIALSRSDRCFSLLSACQDHVNNGRAGDAVKTVRVIRSEGVQFQDDMKTSKRNLQSSEAVQRKQLNEYTDQEHRLQCEINSKKAEIVRYEKDMKDYESAVKRYETEFRQADNDWDRYNRDYQIAKEKLDEFKTWWWVPIYGLILLIREAVEWNSGKMDEADERKRRATRAKTNAERERDRARSMVLKSKSSLENAKRELGKCSKRKDECHQKCTELKAHISTIMQAEKALSDILHMTDSACNNTEQLKQIFEKCSGSVGLKLLQSRGTHMKMAYVGERWRDVNGMVSSNKDLLRNRALKGAMHQ